MSFTKEDGSRNEGQIAYTPQGQSNFQKIFGRNCPNKERCENSGLYLAGDGSFGLEYTECQWCHETTDSKYNKRLGGQ